MCSSALASLLGNPVTSLGHFGCIILWMGSFLTRLGRLVGLLLPFDGNFNTFPSLPLPSGSGMVCSSRPQIIAGISVNR